MKARIFKGNAYGAQLTCKEKQALDKEIRRQILEMDKKYSQDLDAMVLYTLYARFGFGKKRLRQFYEAMYEEHKKLIEHYEMPQDSTWLCSHQLKQIGVDVEAWYNELSDTPT